MTLNLPGWTIPDDLQPVLEEWLTQQFEGRMENRDTQKAIREAAENFLTRHLGRWRGLVFDPLAASAATPSQNLERMRGDPVRSPVRSDRALADWSCPECGGAFGDQEVERSDADLRSLCPTCGAEGRSVVLRDAGPAGAREEREDPHGALEESLSSQIDRLARFIIDRVPGEPSRSEGAVDCAIRVLGGLLERGEVFVGQVEEVGWVDRPQGEEAEAIKASGVVGKIPDFPVMLVKSPAPGSPEAILEELRAVVALLESIERSEPAEDREDRERAVSAIRSAAALLHDQRNQIRTLVGIRDENSDQLERWKGRARKAEAALEEARGEVDLVLAAHKAADVRLGAIREWTHKFGETLCPGFGVADTFGEGVRKAKGEVTGILANDRLLPGHALGKVSTHGEVSSPPIPRRIDLAGLVGANISALEERVRALEERGERVAAWVDGKLDPRMADIFGRLEALEERKADLERLRKAEEWLGRLQEMIEKTEVLFRGLQRQIDRVSPDKPGAGS